MQRLGHEHGGLDDSVALIIDDVELAGAVPMPRGHTVAHGASADAFTTHTPAFPLSSQLRDLITIGASSLSMWIASPS